MTEKKVKLLSGDNPQIPKGEGEQPVKDYIAAVPGWKQAVVRQLDAVISKAVPDVKKAVKWNSPLYGMEPPYWFLSYHCFDKYVKVTFHNGTSLNPQPPVGSKVANVRYLHVSEKEPLDEGQFAAWVKAASKLPGEKM